jgi:hypothetical protein
MYGEKVKIHMYTYIHTQEEERREAFDIHMYGEKVKIHMHTYIHTYIHTQEEERREAFDIHMYGEKVKTLVTNACEQKKQV